jgi:hypothetical protein
MAEETTENERDGGVLAGLPSTRPNRIGRRARGTGATAVEAKPKAKAKAKPKAAKRKAAAKAKAKAAPKAEAVAAEPELKPPTPIAEARKPRPVRAGHPGLAERSGERPKDDAQDPGLAGSVTKAAGELASLGAGVAGSVLKGLGKRLPKR